MEQTPENSLALSAGISSLSSFTFFGTWDPCVIKEGGGVWGKEWLASLCSGSSGAERVGGRKGEEMASPLSVSFHHIYEHR